MSLLPSSLFPAVVGFVTGVASSQVGSALHVLADKKPKDAAVIKTAGVVFNGIAMAAYVGATVTLFSGPVVGALTAGAVFAAQLASKVATTLFGLEHPVGKVSAKIDAVIELSQKVAIFAVAWLLAAPYIATGAATSVLLGFAITLLPLASLVCDDTIRLGVQTLKQKTTELFHSYMGW